MLNRVVFAAVAFSVAILTQGVDAQDLKSWNDGPAKSAITKFVERVTTVGGPEYVPPEERIAVFDNDGTLWSEKPIYFQLAFALDRLKELAPTHPEWQNNPTLKAAIDGDMKKVMAGGEHALLEIVMATHAGITTQEFESIVLKWIKNARHPQTGLLYTEMVYQPMLELMTYLRANGFKTWIVSGGGIEFMRPWAQSIYGIPPEQVVGSTIKVKFEMRDGKPTLVRLPDLDFIDDKEGKPIGIHKFIGRRPIAAFGNSDGDLQMIQWTTAGEGARFGLYLHHTDAAREFAYDKNSSVGRLDQGLIEAAKNGWTVVDMKKAWKQVYPKAATR
ncbi:MAG: HAD family hydrolase [Mariniblastus sp.]|nr:HAD family hydrolase [Mariniblastus sp.]